MPETLVTVKGAKSGKPHTLPLIYIRDEADTTTFALVKSYWGQAHNPAWYYNLKADPHAQCLFAGETREYVAHEAAGEEYENFWQLAAETYLGYPLYQQRARGRHIPIMVLSPAKEHRS